MRSLLILRGAPGAGKSTWIKQNNLENYTLCADDIRLLVESPILDSNTNHRVISQKNDKYVWTLLFELLERRMQNGEFVVIDATHSKSSDFSKYDKLCERYRYRKFYVDFGDVTIEECKKRNLLRPEYKQVPDNVIDKIYSRLKTQGKTTGWKEIDKNNIWNEIGLKLFDMNKYDKIEVFGDIHGCYEPLKEYFDKYPYNENNMYIFCGDYIDRGIQNKEALELLIDLSEKSNTLFLEGNHERLLYYYSIDEIENIKSNTFIKKTIPQIIDIDKSKLRLFYRRIGQLAYFTFGNQKYIITHGGLNYIPEQLQTIATNQLIHGVGDYSDDIDSIFASNYTDTIQIHGHRNTFEIDNIDEKSYNLEGKIEFGGNLKVLQLSKNNKPQLIKIKNNTFGDITKTNLFGQIVYEIDGECKTKLNDTSNILEQLKLSQDIRETKLEENISSFNFTHNAFYKKNWNDITCKARGLFIDTEKNKVVARGYEKFFNINERRETELVHLVVKFKDKITCYKKENGFLGIMSWVNGKMFLASKSNNTGEFANYFRNIYENSKINKLELENYLKNNDVSLTFEVVDVQNDPHIIKYDESKIILLDIIHNKYEFEREPYEKVQELSKLINCECKTIYKEFKNSKDFFKWYIENTDEFDLSKEDIEGVVIESSGIMTKLKFPYYNFWKLMRRIKEQVKNNSNVNLAKLYNDTANYFYDWLKKQDKELLENDIITLREKFYREVNK